MDLRLWGLLMVTAAGAWAQAAGVNCRAAAVPAIVRVEGLSERVGDMVLNCTGGAPGATLRGELTLISFDGPVTNRLLANGALDIVVTANNGSGEAIVNTTAQAVAANQVTLGGLQVVLSATGTVALRITNVRIAPPSATEQAVRVALASVAAGPIRTEAAPFTVGITQRGLLATYATTFLCTQSRLPEVVNFGEFVRRGVRFASVRLTEGFASAFERRGPQTDAGTRLLVRYSGFPAGARLFTPAVVVGSNGATPTSAGDLGLPVSGGRYFSGLGGQLLLARVGGADLAGSGGTPLFTPSGGVGITEFDLVAEVPLVNGAGAAVFEVMDSAANLRESAQVPTFLILEQRPEGGSARAGVALHLGPLSNAAAPSVIAPVPRFQEVAPPGDCTALGDCDANLFPRLAVESAELTYDVLIGSSGQTRYIRVLNQGGGVMAWAASVVYRQGSGWLRLDPESGVNNATIRLDAVADAGFTPGTYEAAVVIDAGPLAGTRQATVRMVARERTTPPAPAPVVTGVTHGAFQDGPLVPGSLGTVFGQNLAGTAVRVTMDGLEGGILYGDSRQINFQLPPGLAGRASAQLIVTVDSLQSTPRAVALATSNPGVFPGAILNQDNSGNAPDNPAEAGSVVQVFLTGLTETGATMRVHDRAFTEALYAGPAPGLIGVQQVNGRIPPDLHTITSDLVICARANCSAPRRISVRQSSR
ncbi:MAG: hypothetical protein ACK6D7_11550 [Acidobacteriota bacterium]